MLASSGYFFVFFSSKKSQLFQLRAVTLNENRCFICHWLARSRLILFFIDWKLSAMKRCRENPSRRPETYQPQNVFLLMLVLILVYEAWAGVRCLSVEAGALWPPWVDAQKQQDTRYANGAACLSPFRRKRTRQMEARVKADVARNWVGH
jgi:hypothetical protein